MLQRISWRWNVKTITKPPGLFKIIDADPLSTRINNRSEHHKPLLISHSNCLIVELIFNFILFLAQLLWEVNYIFITKYLHLKDSLDNSAFRLQPSSYLWYNLRKLCKGVHSKIVKFGGSSLASATQLEKYSNIVKKMKPVNTWSFLPGKRNAEDTKVTDALIRVL